MNKSQSFGEESEHVSDELLLSRLTSISSLVLKTLFEPDTKSTRSTIWCSLPFWTLPTVVVVCTFLTYVGFGVLLCSVNNVDQDGKTPLDVGVERRYKDLPFSFRVSSIKHSMSANTENAHWKLSSVQPQHSQSLHWYRCTFVCVCSYSLHK